MCYHRQLAISDLEYGELKEGISPMAQNPPKKFTSLSHDEYYNQMIRALTEELDARYPQARHGKIVKNSVEMLMTRNGRWFFAYRADDGSYGFDYSDEALGVPSWMAWIPEGISSNKADSLESSSYVFIDKDRTRLYPIPKTGVHKLRVELSR